MVRLPLSLDVHLVGQMANGLPCGSVRHSSGGKKHQSIALHLHCFPCFYLLSELISRLPNDPTRWTRFKTQPFDKRVLNESKFRPASYFGRACPLGSMLGYPSAHPSGCINYKLRMSTDLLNGVINLTWSTQWHAKVSCINFSHH